MRYTGIHKFIDLFKEPVDWEKKAKTVSKAKGTTPEEVMQEWEDKRVRGTEIHLLMQHKIEQEEQVLSSTTPFTNVGEFYESLPEKDDKLEDGIYLERPTFSPKQGLIGFPDRIDVVRGTINVEDYKTFETLHRSSPPIRLNGMLRKEKFKRPISHIDRCNYWESVLQLSLYMFMLWENNRDKRVGKLWLTHLSADADNNILLLSREEVPYMREEVAALLKHKKDNKI